MAEYLNAREVLGRLKMGKVADFSQSYFSQLVRDGMIPFHKLPGKKRKMFIYEEVKAAIEGARDPSRDSQREANARRRKATQSALNPWEAIDTDFNVDQFTIPDKVKVDEVEQEIVTCNTANAEIAAFALDLLATIPAQYHDRIIEAALRHTFKHEQIQETIEEALTEEG